MVCLVHLDIAIWTISNIPNTLHRSWREGEGVRERGGRKEGGRERERERGWKGEGEFQEYSMRRKSKLVYIPCADVKPVHPYSQLSYLSGGRVCTWCTLFSSYSVHR